MSHLRQKKVFSLFLTFYNKYFSIIFVGPELEEKKFVMRKPKKVKKPPVCEFCNKIFKELHSLKRHILTVHEGLKEYKCSSCNKEFGLRGNLIKHVRTVHEGLKNHVCDLW